MGAYIYNPSEWEAETRGSLHIKSILGYITSSWPTWVQIQDLVTKPNQTKPKKNKTKQQQQQKQHKRRQDLFDLQLVISGKLRQKLKQLKSNHIHSQEQREYMHQCYLLTSLIVFFAFIVTSLGNGAAHNGLGIISLKVKLSPPTHTHTQTCSPANLI